ncbi:hypothetical protein KSP40_PGU001435 [Platanthera guangdongensis]|uniref:non-specific serine/threonine protein kinase n=1 Tax=Platanthera guangdongensis TaxID=2320717 RepID=A0ABR2LZ31_9ASPA
MQTLFLLSSDCVGPNDRVDLDNFLTMDNFLTSCPNQSLHPPEKVGLWDIRTMYLAELSGRSCSFVIKIMNKMEGVDNRKKLARAQTERDILGRLDHPFLPTLYTHFETEQHSCLVMAHCSSGDLHDMRQRMPAKCFSQQAAIWRFPSGHCNCKSKCSAPIHNQQGYATCTGCNKEQSFIRFIYNDGRD